MAGGQTPAQSWQGAWLARERQCLDAPPDPTLPHLAWPAGKIMRRVLRKIAAGRFDDLGE